MAKAKSDAKKEETTKAPIAADAAAKAAAAKKPAVKKAIAKAAKGPGAAPSSPLIDTSLAAQNAAKLVAQRDALGEPREGEQRQPESSAFKQLKENLNKPHSQAPASFLQKTAPHKKMNLPFGSLNQVGKGQTFGADVNRSGVPRRTGG